MLSNRLIWGVFAGFLLILTVVKFPALLLAVKLVDGGAKALKGIGLLLAGVVALASLLFSRSNAAGSDDRG